MASPLCGSPALPVPVRGCLPAFGAAAVGPLLRLHLSEVAPLPVPERGCLPASGAAAVGPLLSFRSLVRLVCCLSNRSRVWRLFSFLFSAKKVALVFGVCYWFSVLFCFFFLFVLGAFVSVFWVRLTFFLVSIQWHRKIRRFLFFQNDLALKGD